MVVCNDWKLSLHDLSEHTVGSSNALSSPARPLPPTAETSRHSALGSLAAHTGIAYIGTLWPHDELVLNERAHHIVTSESQASNLGDIGKVQWVARRNHLSRDFAPTGSIPQRCHSPLVGSWCYSSPPGGAP